MFIFLAILSAIQSAAAFSTPSSSPFKGLSSVNSIRVPRPDLPSSQPTRKSFQECFIYPDFVIVQLDSGSKGADAISIRPLQKRSDFQKACHAKTWKEEKFLPNQEQYFLGVLSHFLFTRSADVFGNLGFFWVYQLKTGEQIFTSGYDYEKGVELTANQKKVSAEYYQQLKTPCSLASSDSTCWSQILVENKIPKTSQMEPPDCGEAFYKLDFEKNPSLRKLNNILQLFAKVKVSDLGNSEPLILDNQITCYATP